ncbi:MAG: hypothetical protein RML92_06220 [Bacteroidia bacterium]|nr:hypothetical protein [Bacteroidia bacterium]
MRRFIPWIWLACAWAQESLVWDWHGEGDAGNGYHQPGEASQLHSRVYNRLRLTGDTLWVLGRVCIPANEYAYLPNPNGAPPIPLQIPPVTYRREAGYLALYHRTSGDFLGAFIAYAQAGAQYSVRFADFQVSENRDTIWIAVNLPTGGCTPRINAVTAQPTFIFQTATSATFSLTLPLSYTMESDQSTAQVWQVSKIANFPPSTWHIANEAIYWSGTGNLSLGINGMAYRPGAIYIAGTMRLPALALTVHNLSPSTLRDAFGLGYIAPSGNPAFPFWIKLATGTSFGSVVGAVLFRGSLGINAQGYGRALVIKGDTLLALYNIRRDAAGNRSMQYQIATSGGSYWSYGDLTVTDNCMNNWQGHMYVSAFRTSDLRPVDLGSLSSSTAQLFCGDYSVIPSVGTLYPWVSGDTLWLAWAEDRRLNISNLSTTRAIFSYWTGLGNFPSLNIGFGMPWVVQNRVWTGMTRTVDGSFFFTAVDHASGSGYLGVHSPSTAMVNTMLPGEGTGIVADAVGHLYIFGVGRVNSVCYERLRPRVTFECFPLNAGSLSPHISPPLTGYGKSWIGRLLRYRAQVLTGSLPPNTCVPDTFQRNLSFRFYGRFDAPSDSIAFLWNDHGGGGTGYSISGRPRWTIAKILPPPGGVDTAIVQISSCEMFGRMKSSSYRLLGGVAGWFEMENLLPTVPPPSLTITVNSNKAPSIHPAEGQRYWVYPFAGGPDATIGWRQASVSGAPFLARSAYLDGADSIFPSYTFTYIPIQPYLMQELLYVAVNYPDSVILYRLDIATGEVHRERGWARIPDPRPSWAASEDSIVYGIQQLVWNAQTGSLIAVEGAYRLRVIYPFPYISSSTLSRHISFFMNNIYGDLRHFPIVAFSLLNGEVACAARLSTSTHKTYLLRDNLFAPMTALSWPAIPIDESEDSHDPCFTEDIASPRAITASGHNLYFLDWGKNPGGCAEYLLLLRSMNISFSPTAHTLDTIYRSPNRADMDSVRARIVFCPAPEPHLVFPLRLPSGEGYIMRYWLDGRPKPKDTLIGGVLVGSWSCEYSVDRWSPLINLPRAMSLEVTRGGTILFSANHREIRAAIPLYINTPQQDTTTWFAEGNISTASTSLRDIRLHWNGDTLRWVVDSLRAHRDTLFLRARLSSCGAAWPMTLRLMVLPSSPHTIHAPSVICQGEVFPIHGAVPSRDETLLLYLFGFGEPAECGFQKLIEHIFMDAPQTVLPPGRAQRLNNGLYVALDTCISPACQVTLSLPAGLVSESSWLSKLVENTPISKSFRIRRGLQATVKVALEATTRSDGTQAPHPGLSRLGLYKASIGNTFGDSLMEWGVLGSLPWYWEANSLSWRRIGGQSVSDSSTTPSAWYTPTWVTPCLVLLRESASGPAVDSVWGFIDSLGRVWKWAPPMVDTTDCPSCPDRGYYQPWRLSFCRCDTATPKWIVIRFPQHLPLRSSQAVTLSRDPQQPTLIDFRDPTYVDGVPGEHYALLPISGGTWVSASWSGNCADEYRNTWPGTPQGAAFGVVNAADYEFLLLRNGVLGTGIFTPADVDCDGAVTAADMIWVIQNQNFLRQSPVND